MIQLCGRSIKVQTGKKSQTVNIFTSANRNGQYDYKIRLTPPSITEETLIAQHFTSITEIVKFLEAKHHGVIEQVPAVRASSTPKNNGDRKILQGKSRIPLTEFFNSSLVNNFSSLSQVADSLNEFELQRLYEMQSKDAPMRGEYKSYFQNHTGETISGLATNRREEHLAIALWRTYRQTGFPLADGTIIFPIDYQLPLKSHNDHANTGLGKVDLICADTVGEPWICELKVHSKDLKVPETPLKALLEALSYCAILDADMRNLSRESHEKRHQLLHTIHPSRPNLLILAPSEYWKLCEAQESRFPWKNSLQALCKRIETTFKVKVKFVCIDHCSWQMDEELLMPCLLKRPIFTGFNLGIRVNLRSQIEQWQMNWAQRNHIPLGPPPGNPSSQATDYVSRLEDNLFEPLSNRVKNQLIHGAGGELNAPDGQSGNLYAVYSSSALCVNFFHHYSQILEAGSPKTNSILQSLPAVLGLPSMPVQSIDFEVANIVNPQFKTAPHLDVQIRFADESLKCAAIESKFCEPYGQIKTTSLNPAYLREKSLWQSWPHLHSFAHPISTEELAFSHLDAAQLIRHLLGLQKQFGNNFVLIYLWFDMPGVTAAQAHRNEIEQFHSLLLKDHISFISRTYQEVIKALHNNEIDSDKLHSKYLIQRYLDLEL